MKFRHNFDLGTFHLSKDNGDGTAYFCKDEELSCEYHIRLFPDMRLYPWGQMSTTDGFNLSFCKVSKCVVLEKTSTNGLYGL